MAISTRPNNLARPQETDTHLIIAAQKGDTLAFEQIVKQWERPLFSYVARMMRRQEDVEEIVQESFYKVYRALWRYDHTKKFSTWIYTITKRTTYDWLRKKRSRRELYILDDPDSLFETADPSTPYKEIDNKIDVLRALKHLPKKYQTILRYYYWNQRSYREIGKLVNIPINSVKTSLRRAKIALKKYLL